MKKYFLIPMLILLSLFLLTGCAESTPASQPEEASSLDLLNPPVLPEGSIAALLQQMFQTQHEGWDTAINKWVALLPDGVEGFPDDFPLPAPAFDSFSTIDYLFLGNESPAKGEPSVVLLLPCDETHFIQFVPQSTDGSDYAFSKVSYLIREQFDDCWRDYDNMEGGSYWLRTASTEWGTHLVQKYYEQEGEIWTALVNQSLAALDSGDIADLPRDYVLPEQWPTVTSPEDFFIVYYQSSGSWPQIVLPLDDRQIITFDMIHDSAWVTNGYCQLSEPRFVYWEGSIGQYIEDLKMVGYFGGSNLPAAYCAPAKAQEQLVSD